MINDLLCGVDRVKATRLAGQWYGDTKHPSGKSVFSLYSTLAAMVVEEWALAKPQMRPDAFKAYDPPSCWHAALLLGTFLYTPTNFDTLCRAASLQVAELVAVLTPDKRLAGPRQRLLYHAAVRSFTPQAKLLCLLHVRQQAQLFTTLLSADLVPSPTLLEEANTFREDAQVLVSECRTVQTELPLPLPELATRCVADLKRLAAAIKQKGVNNGQQEQQRKNVG